MADDDATITEVAERIRAHIESQFARGSTRVFLSSLGSDLVDEKKQVEKLSGLKFAEFIRSNFDFPIGKAGEHQNVLYIAPQGTTPGPVEELGLRFKPSLWTAFARPLVDDEERFLNLRTLRFGTEAAIAVGELDDLRRIDAKFVATEETSRDVPDMIRRIDEWLAEQNLDREPFLVKSRKPSHSKTSPLLELIAALNPDQLQRTSLPLDVVKSLLS